MPQRIDSRGSPGLRGTAGAPNNSEANSGVLALHSGLKPTMKDYVAVQQDAKRDALEQVPQLRLAGAG